VQHEWIGIGTQLGHDEGHALRHQRGYKRHIAGKTLELGHYDRAPLYAASGQRCRQLRPAVERIGTFAGLDLDELSCEREAFCLGEAGHGRSLSLDAESRTALASGRDAVVGDGLLHVRRVRCFLYKLHTTVCRLYVANTLISCSNIVAISRGCTQPLEMPEPTSRLNQIW
jgi:hypothetical protein